MRMIVTLFALTMFFICLIGYSLAQEEAKKDTTPPIVVSIEPADETKDVRPGLTTISVTFNEEMQDGSWSWNRADEGEFPHLTTEPPRYDVTHTTCSMSVFLLPGRKYAIAINSPDGGAFKDRGGNPATFYKWSFTTSGTEGDVPEYIAQLLRDGKDDVRRAAMKESMSLEYDKATDVFAKALDGIHVMVDPRIELLAVVQYLSNYGECFGLITRFGMPYREDIMKYFDLFKDHLAVKLFTKMSNDGFSFDAPPTAMLYLSNPPGLNQQLPFSNYLKERAGGEEQLNGFIQALRDFARETQFMTFFQAHQGTFLKSVADSYEKMKGIDYINDMENYYGMKQHGYYITLAPLFHEGGFGPRIEQADGTYDIYNICGPNNAANGFPIFGTKENFRWLIWHEWSHSFVNPITEKHGEQVSKYSSLYEPISNQMRSQAYGDWNTCVNEHIVRAVTTRLAYIKLGKEAGDKSLLNEKRRSFFYVEALCNRLEQYEKQRDKYPTFADFYPELIDVFRELSERKLGDDFYSIPSVPYTGTINAVFSDKKSVIIIIPMHENNKEIQDRIHEFVREYHDQFLKESPILTDEEALKQDLSDNSLVIFGTMTGNLWLAQKLTKFPVRIESDKVVADATYDGTHLRFISAWLNPQNPKKGMVIYTAQQADDIIDINRVFHGPTDYVIGEGTEVLKGGNYNKQNGIWSFDSK